MKTTTVGLVYKYTLCGERVYICGPGFYEDNTDGMVIIIRAKATDQTLSSDNAWTHSFPLHWFTLFEAFHLIEWLNIRYNRDQQFLPEI
jgi:hypothetical protein